MVHLSALTAAAILLAAPATAAGLYPKSSAVLQVDAKSYDRLIAKSNHTSIVEFYAPWCGHCKNLQPAFERAAKNLAGLAKVAAVNCDDDENKQFCGSMGVKGFPTLKIVKPGKKSGLPVVQDYNGAREAKGIVDAVIQNIPNHVKKVTDRDLESFLEEGNSTAKAILFTEKGTTSALLKAVAVDFLGSIKVAQIRNKEKKAVELFGITEYPTIVLLPGGVEAEGIVYDGEIKKAPLVNFLSQVAAPNPDPAPAKINMPKKKDDKKADKKAKEAFESASSSHASSEGPGAAASATDETLEATELPTESPNPVVGTSEAPVIVQDIAPALPILKTTADLARSCLDVKSGTCVLAFVPATQGDTTPAALTSLAEIAHKYTTAKRQIFPFYIVPDDNSASAELTKSLELSQDVEIIAINSKRGWWKHFKGSDHSLETIEGWIDAIRMGEGEKQRLPGGVIVEKTPESEAQKPVGEAPRAEAEAEPVAAKEAEPETSLEAEPIAVPTAVAIEETVEPEAEPTAPTHNEL
ncbi:MAG: hypothetical protein M1818_006765 [Claussenomyces sp. TS43310]|nr:MAG: hypothetical protein M1818_006765 [Claussenomyces sp. TS43310]